MSSKVQIDAVKDILDASKCGRSILCLIGAGASVDAGIPPLSKLTEYLAKVQCYITNQAFQARRRPDDVRPRFGEHYRDDPSQYVRDFGWPDPNCLNADLWQWIGQSFGKEEERPADFRRYLDYHVRAERIEDLLKIESGLEKSLSGAVKQQRKDRREGTVRFEAEEWNRSGLWHLEGNWKTLLAHLTHSNPDYADTLFQGLIRDRHPGMFHRFLAFLTPILGLRLFLTINFDDLLEEALRLEGYDPVVYAVSRDSPLPHPSLVRSQLSVVKMHGDAFRLMVGEDLDAPLDENSKKRLDEYVGENPLLLVLGVGGADRRVMDFVELVAAKKGEKKGDCPTVYWLHFGPQCPGSVSRLAEKWEGAVCTVPTYSPGSFLLELLNRQTHTHPPSFEPYEPKMPRPIMPQPRERRRDAGSAAPGGEEAPIWVFLDVPGEFDFGAPLELAHFVAARARTHTPIWIDLSLMYQFEEVVVEIIHQIRRYDRSVPPLSLPGGPAAEDGSRDDLRPAEREGVAKAVRRIYDALGRDRYVLALNGVGSFGRPPTWHHWPRRDTAMRSEDKVKDLLRSEFLRELVRQASRPEVLRESMLALSISPGDTDPKLLPDLLAWAAISTHAGQRTLEREEGPSEEEQKRFEDALLLLAAFRHRRSYVALLQLLPEYLTDKEEGASREEVDQFLEDVESRFILRAEGGEYWICRRMRDHIYETGKRGSSPQDWRRILKNGVEPEKCDPLLQIARLCRIHRDLARYCYSHLYLASQEPFALLDAVYHKISSLRYLARLEAWMRLVPGEELSKEQRRSLERLTGREHAEAKEAIRAVRELRWQGMRTLRRAFAREREPLLSLICSDTLIGWVEWIRREDLRRCQAGFWLKNLKPLRDVKDRALDAALERQHEVLDEQLLDLQGDALRHKMDFSNCMQVCFQQIRNLVRQVRLPTGEASLDRYLEDLVEACRAALSGKRKLNLQGQAKLVQGLCDIWHCLRGMGRHEEAASRIGALLESHVTQGRWRASSREEEEGLEAMTIRWLRGAADQQLTAISPWTLRGASEPDQRKARESCERALALCNQALGTIGWATGDDYARHRSYFHSLQGRAFYLQAFLGEETLRTENFSSAHRELDCARAGLAPRVGLHRVSLAVSLLRSAECLMIRADKFLDGSEPAEISAAMASAVRELDRSAETLDRAESMLVGARQNLEWWSCLYQLRAQIQVERLLLLIAGYQSREAEPVDARLPLTVRAGLNAVRQGLDVLLPISLPDGRTEPHFRIERFLRIWLELAVCAAFLARIGWHAAKEKKGGDETEDLWGRWMSMNEAAGLESLVRQGLPDQLKTLIGGAPAPSACRLEARREALDLMVRTVEANVPWERSWIWKRLLQEEPCPQATPQDDRFAVLPSLPFPDLTERQAALRRARGRTRAGAAD